QCQAELGLQALQDFSDCRLCQTDSFGSSAHILLIGQYQENTGVFYAHVEPHSHQELIEETYYLCFREKYDLRRPYVYSRTINAEARRSGGFGPDRNELGRVLRRPGVSGPSYGS